MTENVTLYQSIVTESEENVIAFNENVTVYQSIVTESEENVTAFNGSVISTIETGAGEISLMERIMSSIQYKMAEDIAHYVAPCSLALGLPGNVLAFVVILRMRPFTTSSFLFCGMAVSDFLYLCASAFYRTPHKSQEAFKVACLAGEFMVWSFTFMSLTFSLLLAVERALAVWRPLQVSSLVTMRRGVVVVAVLMVGSVMLNVHHLFVFDLVFSPQHNAFVCISRPELAQFMKHGWWTISIFLTSLGPAAVFLCSNIIIFLGLKKSKQFQEQMTSGDSQLKSRARQSRQVTWMLMSVLTLFIVTNFPFGILFVSVRTHAGNWGTPTHLWMIFFSTLFVNMKDFNHALNCYCYFMSAHRFRSGVLDLLTCGGRVKIKVARLAAKSAVTSVSTVESVSMASKG